MSKARNVPCFSADGSEEGDMAQYYIDKFDSGDASTSIGAGRVDLDIIDVLTQRGHVARKHIDPRLVAIHHENRGGVIGNSMNLDPMVKNITELSFSWKECEHAMCIGVAPGDTTTEDAYRIWCEESNVDLPPVPEGSIKYASLACGHTNTCLRAMKCLCLSTHPIFSDGSRYCMENITRKD